jgi:type IV pilus biogenesis protein CpaD/CtpE
MISAPARFLAVLVAALAVGCAAVDEGNKGPAEPVSQREYRTGSNIPVRDVKPATEEERARAVEQARELQRNSATTKQ